MKLPLPRRLACLSAGAAAGLLTGCVTYPDGTTVLLPPPPPIVVAAPPAVYYAPAPYVVRPGYAYAWRGYGPRPYWNSYRPGYRAWGGGFYRGGYRCY